MFPLLDLPSNALNNVLRRMDKLSLMFFSMLSHRVMAHVKLLKLGLKNLIVDLYDRVCLRLEFENHDRIEIYLDSNGISYDLGMLITDTIVVKFITDSESGEYIYSVLKYPNVRHWIDHLLSIFSCQYVDLRFFELRTLSYSFESIVKTLEGIPIRVLQAADIYDVFRRVLHYFPTPRLLNLFGREFEGTHPAPCSEFMAKLLIQNFDALYFHSSIPITLDSLLLMNTPFFWTFAPKLSDRELNMYIRFWMNNPSSKLECLALCYHLFDEYQQGKAFNKSIILKGIDYIERPSDLKRDFQFSIDFHQYHGNCMRLDGGYDITRRDGTTCTVFLDSDDAAFAMFVWP